MRIRASSSTTRLWLLAMGLSLVMLLAGCLRGDREYDGGLPSTDSEEDPGTVRVGIPDPETGIGFIELLPDGEIVLDTFGQGGSHAELAMECAGFGNAVYPTFALENLATGTRIVTPPYARPQLLVCDDDDRCVRSPHFVMLGGLAGPDELDDLHVRVTMIAENEAGLHREASQTGYLRRAD